nr:TraM recognition domain-containing protein [Caldicoprobacter algeriensis]
MLETILRLVQFSAYATIGGAGVWCLSKLLSANEEQTIQDLLRHTWTIGETGTGKSTKARNDILSVIKQGYGCLFIDVHGHDSRELLDEIPPEHIDRTIYIDAADYKRPIGISIFDKSMDPFQNELQADNLVSIFDILWPGFIGPSTEDLLRMAALAVIEQEISTLYEIYLILVSEEYRNNLKIQDTTVKEFWQVTFPELIKKDKSRLNPPTNKLRKLIMSRTCRLMLCQSSPKLNIRKAMNEGKIIICNFAKGHIGHITSRLLAAIMMVKVQLATFTRNNNAQPFFVFCDEFQNYVTESFVELLSEARKYKISLNLYHQFFAQLPRQLQHAIRGNVGSRYAFRVDDDCEMVAEMLGVDPDDIRNLQNYWYYAKRLINGKREDKAVKKKSPPPPKKYNLSQHIINNSRLSYGVSYTHILKEIEKRSEFGGANDGYIEID